MIIRTASISVSARSSAGDDRFAVITAGTETIIVLADGSGGTGAGAQAADALVEHVKSSLVDHEQLDPAHTLRAADELLFRMASTGETTGVIVAIRKDGISGASVGDSEAWLVQDAAVLRLTNRQNRKPLLGTGAAVVVPFTDPLASGTLVVGSDGLFKYASEKRIVEMVRGAPLPELPRRLVDLVRLRSRGVPDDIAVVACQIA